MVTVKPALIRLSGALALASLVSIGLWAGGYLTATISGYSYMLWNLALAWLPFIFILWLLRMLLHKRWSSWEGIIISLLWLTFLPNSFYMLSDLIHIREATAENVLFITVMLTSFALIGLLLGYVSLYLFHNELRRRLPDHTSRHIVALVLLLCSFAIYLGRDLRWNSWDLLVNPFGLIFDISNRFISPMAYPGMFVVTGSFFILLASIYFVLWNIISVLRRPVRR